MFIKDLPRGTFGYQKQNSPDFLAAVCACVCAWSALAHHVILTHLDVRPPAPPQRRSSLPASWASPSHMFSVFLEDGSRLLAVKFSVSVVSTFFRLMLHYLFFLPPVAMDYGGAAIMPYESHRQKMLRSLMRSFRRVH